MKKVILLMIVTSFVSCSANYVHVKRIKAPQKLHIIDISLYNKGDVYTYIPIGVRYFNTRRMIKAPKNHDILFLAFGLSNYSGKKYDVRLKNFHLVVNKQKIYPVACSLPRRSWAVRLHEDSSRSVSTADIYLAYFVPKGTRPEKVALGDYGEIQIPVKKQ